MKTPDFYAQKQRKRTTTSSDTKKQARELRRYCDGKFGNMDANAWNDRIVGTGGDYRQPPKGGDRP